jgi:8-hydroxy-5-deazaflavin:NADPH oxidoreductase
VVKAFNIITAYYIANPKLKQGTADMFIAGNDPSAKKAIIDIARTWGWEVIDIGGIEQSYLLEALALLWIRYGFLNNYWKHAFKLLKE